MVRKITQHIPSVSCIQGLMHFSINCIYDSEFWIIGNERRNEMATEFLELNNSLTKLRSDFKLKINSMLYLAF